jgi:Zn-dependent protease
MEISATQIRWILIDVLVLVVSVALHEFGHAFVADRLGDDTPRRQGRVTLNPLAHADPIGTLLLPLAGGIFGALGGGGGGFGWGKPVQWNPRKVRRGITMAKASILVSIAGPGMNLLLGIVLAFVHVLLRSRGVVHETYDPTAMTLDNILRYATNTNFVLLFFNLIPAPPLDGGHVAEHLTPYRHRDKFYEYAKYGPIVVAAVAFIPQVARVFLWPALFCADHTRELWGHVFGVVM